VQSAGQGGVPATQRWPQLPLLRQVFPAGQVQLISLPQLLKPDPAHARIEAQMTPAGRGRQT
jgi:hypothetical protein